jgi:hypothetical protein
LNMLSNTLPNKTLAMPPGWRYMMSLILSSFR